MTLTEMVERYGEAEVVRWAQTGRLAEKVLDAKSAQGWVQTYIRKGVPEVQVGGGAQEHDVYAVKWYADQYTEDAGEYKTLLAALEAADA